MSYLSRLKQLAGDEKFTDSPRPEPTELTKGAFGGFVSTVPGVCANISANDSAVASSLEVGAGDTARTPTDDRMEREAGKLRGNPAMTYAMTAHDDIDPEAVILTLAIRGKGACEIRIPKSRYDAFALLELIEKHTTRETLQ